MRQLLAMKLQVRCADGATHDGVRLFIEDNRRVYVAEDGSEISEVETIEQCTSVVPPMVLARSLHACKESD